MLRFVFHFLLLLTYSSERGAALAYRGHAKAVRSEADRLAIAQIEQDEWHHREELLGILEEQGLKPWKVLEGLFWMIGSTVGFGCKLWGEWASAYGASSIEVNGVSEYRRLAVFCRRLDDEPLALRMDAMAHQEQAHRDYFYRLAKARWMGGRAEVSSGD